MADRPDRADPKERSDATDAPEKPLIEPQTGPGLMPSARPDPVMITAVVFALLGLLPTRLFRTGVDLHLGPLEVPAIFAIVGVLFGVLGLLRGIELEDRFIQVVSSAAGVVGLVRLFIYPLAGW